VIGFRPIDPFALWMELRTDWINIVSKSIMPSSFDFVDRPRVARAAYPQAPVRFPPFGEANRSTKTMIEEPAPPKPFTFGKKSAIGRRRPSGHLVSLIILLPSYLSLS
jgi:hypothetical protein